MNARQATCGLVHRTDSRYPAYEVGIGQSTRQLLRPPECTECLTSRDLYCAVLGLDFLLDYTADGLQKVLVSSGLEGKLRELGASPVTFSKMGFRTEGRRVSLGLIGEKLDPKKCYPSDQRESGP